MLKRIFQFALPYYCVLCSLPAEKRDLCQACMIDLPKLANHRCQTCALNVPANDVLCAQCLQQKPAFHQVIAGLAYQFPVNKMLTTFKFNGKLLYGDLLSEILCNTLCDFYRNQTWPEVMLPVPLHTNRLRRRGFNQALEICRYLESRVPTQLQAQKIIRWKNTQAQSELNAKLRNSNVKTAFQLPSNLQATHIALVDDLLTSGHTANEISKLLIKSGCQKVDIWCLARALKKCKINLCS